MKKIIKVPKGKRVHIYYTYVDAFGKKVKYNEYTSGGSDTGKDEIVIKIN